VQIEAPKDNFPGRTVQGMYVVEDKVVTLVDHVGNPFVIGMARPTARNLSQGKIRE
jgi:hypothetical protein